MHGPSTPLQPQLDQVLMETDVRLRHLTSGPGVEQLHAHIGNPLHRGHRRGSETPLTLTIPKLFLFRGWPSVVCGDPAERVSTEFSLCFAGKESDDAADLGCFVVLQLTSTAPSDAETFERALRQTDWAPGSLS